MLHAAAQVCTLLSGLVVQSMALAAGSSMGSQAAGVGSEYQILLSKRLRSAELGECRMGVIAARCLIARLAREETQVCISEEYLPASNLKLGCKGQSLVGSHLSCSEADKDSKEQHACNMSNSILLP